MDLASLAEKYNWWSPNKKDISPNAVAGYVLRYGDLDELIFVIKDFKDLVEQQLDKLIVDPMLSFDRKKMLYFLTYHKLLSDEDIKKAMAELLGLS